MSCKGGVPQSAGTGSKFDFSILLLHTKREKVEFFSYPSCKFENKALVACPYPPRPTETHFMLSELTLFQLGSGMTLPTGGGHYGPDGF